MLLADLEALLGLPLVHLHAGSRSGPELVAKQILWLSTWELHSQTHKMQRKMDIPIVLSTSDQRQPRKVGEAGAPRTTASDVVSQN